MNPTTEIRSHRLGLNQPNNTVIAKPVSTESFRNSSGLLSATQRKPTSYASASDRVNIANAQQQIVRAQVAQQALSSIGKELHLMKRSLTQAYSPGRSGSAELGHSLLAHKEKIMTILSSSTFEGQRVLSATLDIQLQGDTSRSFTIPGLNLSRQREQDELVRLDFPNVGSTVVAFNRAASDKQLMNQIDRSVLAIGMRANIGEQADIKFVTSEAKYEQAEKSVLVTGQGHRYPSGQPNMLNLKGEPEGLDELDVSVSNRDSVRKLLTSVNKQLKAVQQGLEKTVQDQQKISEDIAPLGEHGSLDLTQMLTRISGADSRFSDTLQMYSAQANVRRHSVVALLR